MKYLPRVFITFASLLLVSLFIWPMWTIRLLAPQYPEGVDMYIYINKIGGKTPGTLQNVNILNHYIGMKKIEPDSIPELKFMPPIVLFFIVAGFITAFFDKKYLYWAWSLAFIAILILGLYDFYLWEYDYGHNLDPNAPMKFEGASFQPPLIGRKDIINFVAVSMPNIAGYLTGVAVMFSLLAIWFKTKTQKKVVK